MTRKEKALEYFRRGFHCSQAVLASYADLCGLTEKQALKLGACFGSGMRKGEVHAQRRSMRSLLRGADGSWFPVRTV